MNKKQVFPVAVRRPMHYKELLGEIMRIILKHATRPGYTAVVQGQPAMPAKRTIFKRHLDYNRYRMSQSEGLL